jgi:hypothetical protein
LKYVIRGMAVVLVLLKLSGCATIVSGKTQEVVFDSSPSGARIEVNGATRGMTPSKVVLTKKENNPIVIKKEGFKPVTVVPSKGTSGWFWGNIVFGGLFGSTTDGVTGGMYKFAPDSYFVTLEPENGPARMSDNLFLLPGDEAEVKQFVLASYSSLSENIATGQGQYLDTLYQLVKVQPADRAQALNKLRGIMVAFPNIVDFANGVITAFPQPSRVPAAPPQ